MESNQKVSTNKQFEKHMSDLVLNLKNACENYFLVSSKTNFKNQCQKKNNSHFSTCR